MGQSCLRRTLSMKSYPPPSTYVGCLKLDRHGRTATTYTCIIRAFENSPTEKKTGRSSDHLAPNANAARIRNSTRASSFEGTPKTAPCIKRTHFTRVHTLPTRVQRVQTPRRRKTGGGGEKQLCTAQKNRLHVNQLGENSQHYSRKWRCYPKYRT